MLGRIHKDELPDYWELSPDAMVQAYKDQQRGDRRKVTSWFLPIVACLPAIAFMTSKPVNDGVSLVANALGMMNAAASWVTPNAPAQSEQTAAIDDPKVMAFLDTIAWAEGTGDSYDIAFGFNKVDIFGGHPDQVFCNSDKSLCSAASGRYQEMPDTWNATASTLGIKDFSPQSQDKVVIQQLKDLGAYDQIKSGDIAGVFCKLGHVWASFPCNSYGQGQKQSSQLEQIYQEKLAARSGQKTADAVQPTIATTGFKDWSVSLPQNTDNQTALVAIGLSKVLGLKVGSGESAATPAATATGKTVFPLKGFTWQTATKSSGFGKRKSPITGEDKMHWGQDLPAAKGTPVLATQSGTVLDVKLSDSGCGNEIELQFADGTGDRFCHLSAVHVEKGQSVNAGDAIGEVGSTGDSTGDHLHFEHVVNGESVDPTERLESLGNDASAQPAAATSDQPSNTDPKASVFCVEVILDDGSIKCASGFSIAPDKIITDHHVTGDNPTVIVRDINGQKFTAGVIKTDPNIDLSLLQVDSANFPVMPMGSSPAMGDKVQTLGHKHGADELTVIDTAIDGVEMGCGVPGVKCLGVPAGGLFDGFSGGLLLFDGKAGGINRALFEADQSGRIIPIEVVKQFAGGQ